MPIASVYIPQIGEGLQEARLVAVLKQPGEHVKRDEPIYQMETDKAVLDIESPYEGTIVEWLAEIDAILPIGAEVARMETESSTVKQEAETKGATIPPRTRAYAKEKGVPDDVLQRLAEQAGKLMPADIDAYLGTAAAPAGNREFQDQPVPAKQRVLNSRMQRGAQLVVPGTITAVVDWAGIEAAKVRLRAVGGEFQPSAFTMLAYAVAQTVKEFPLLRTSIIGEDVFRTYDNLSLGIAVSLPGDELVLAVVRAADKLEWAPFAAAARDAIDLARGGKDQANESVTLSLTNMQNFGLRDAVPVVVPPACATLYIGEIYPEVVLEDGSCRSRNVVNLALTFDHRVMNGVGAAAFMKSVKDRIEGIEALLAR